MLCLKCSLDEHQIQNEQRGATSTRFPCLDSGWNIFFDTGSLKADEKLHRGEVIRPQSWSPAVFTFEIKPTECPRSVLGTVTIPRAISARDNPGPRTSTYAWKTFRVALGSPFGRPWVALESSWGHLRSLDAGTGAVSPCEAEGGEDGHIHRKAAAVREKHRTRRTSHHLLF